MIRKPFMAALAASAASVLALALGSASASAFEGRPAFGSPFGSISYGTGIAIDQSTGNVFVADDNVNMIRVFGPNGEAPIGGGPASFSGAGSHDKEFTFYYKGGIAFDSKNHVLYIPNTGSGSVDKYKFEGGEWKYQCEFLGGGATGDACTAEGTGGEQFKESLGTAVDSAGDLYVAQWSGPKIYEFNSGGEQVASFAMSILPEYVAVGSTGTLYVVPWYNEPVMEFKRSSLTGAIEGAGKQIGTAGVSGVAYNESNGDLILDHGGFIEELNSKNELVSDTVSGELDNSGEGVGVNETTNHLYANDATAKTVVQFGLSAVLPDATTNTPAPVERDRATLKGTLNPDKTKAKYWFEYGPANEPYKTVGSKEEIPGEPEEAIVVALPITGLASNTTYHFRLVTENSNGVSPGKDVEFTTPVAVENQQNEPATNVAVASATLNATLEPNAVAATCWFKWGAEYSFNKETAHASAGSASGKQTFSQPVTGLEPNKEYDYVLECENSFGTSAAPGVTSFTSLKEHPAVLSQEAKDISRQRAVLAALVNPENDATTYYYEYGLTTGYGYKTPETPLLSSKYGEVVAQAPAVELETNTIYHFRIVITNSAGTVRGADATFTSGSLTPPVVTTGGAIGINQNGATIEGVVDTEGLVTSYGFQIGTSEDDLGPTTGQGSVGAGFDEAAVSLVLHGLQPSTKYYYRIVGANVDSVNGESTGAISHFETTAYPNPNITVDQLRVLHAPFVVWPTESNLIYPKGEEEKPATTKCKKGTVKKNGKCVKKKKSKGKGKKAKGKNGKGKKKK